MPGLTIGEIYDTLQQAEAARIRKHLQDDVDRNCTKFNITDPTNVNSIKGVWISTTDKHSGELLSTIMVGLHKMLIVADTEIGKMDAESYINLIENKYQNHPDGGTFGRLKSFICEFQLVILKSNDE